MGRSARVAALVGSAAMRVVAQTPDSSSVNGHPAIPPIRVIATASAVSTERIGSINGVRELPDGRLLLNDAARRRLVILDTTLKLSRVVLDSAARGKSMYGTGQVGLVAHRGDSTLFLDNDALAILLIDPAGNVVRVRAIPGVQNVFDIVNAVPGFSRTDARGRLVLRLSAAVAYPSGRMPRGVRWVPENPDSAFVIALDLDTRALDTVGTIRTPKQRFVGRVGTNGVFAVHAIHNPLPTSDAWAVLSDGSIALVRSIDYRVDYNNPDGSWSSSPKIPYEWQRLSDSAKTRLVDSLYSAMLLVERSTYVSAVIRWVNTHRRKYPPNFSAPAGYTPPNGFGRHWQMPPGVVFPANYVYGCAPDEEATMVGGRPSCIPLPVVSTGQAPAPPTMREPSVMPARELPNYAAPFGPDAARADMDGNLWILTVRPKAVPGGRVYDVIDRQGVLVDRIQIPTGYELAGFGRGGVVFLGVRSGNTVQLARVRLMSR